MPKRSAGGVVGSRAVMRPCTRQHQQQRQKHLYLVLDDWEWGYSIRKVDLSSSEDADPADSDDERLPPAVFRLEAQRAFSGLFAAFGTKIMATHRRRGGRDVPMFDVRSRALNFGPLSKTEPNVFCAVYVEAGGKLFLLDQTCFETLDPPPPPPGDDYYYRHYGDDDEDPKADWKWRGLPSPPFHVDNDVVAHAVHPDDRTLFFSTAKHTTKRSKFATFSFDTALSEWTCHGAWRLPFQGRGFFDRDLDAWVGLSGDPESPDALGHLYASQVVSVDDADADGQQQPARKLSKETLFCTEPGEKHIGATLVYMGGGSRYCVVQCLSVRGSKEHLLRLGTFSLKYDMNGDLRVATYGRVRSYRLPEMATRYRDHLEKPVAFWM